ncbi:hypothetical protein HJC23_011167 [Cyclotella cryptica]|uniref:Sulfotransferase n=1 Tax=Cyclotella cryptica TaxID=29204 RepID=A0ABD3P5L8_9STRA
MMTPTAKSTILLMVLFSMSSTLLLQSKLESHTRIVVPTSPIYESSRGDKIMNFMVHSHSPHKFVDAFVQCAFHSPKCRIHYHHVQKTGGSRLASRLYPVLSNPPGKSYQSKQWCCEDDMMARFHANVSHYCRENKFGIYEVAAPKFSSVVQSCLNYPNASDQMNSKNVNVHEPSEIVVLMTIREPIQLTLSQIHHQCNKNYNQKTKQEKQMCRTCSYKGHPDYFLSYVHQTNLVYQEIASEIPKMLKMFEGARRVNETVSGRHKIMILDQADINRFFESLAISSPNGTVIPEGRGNEELVHKCYFGMTSHMMKALAPALEVYRKLTSGIVFSVDNAVQSGS